jgi:hypothetical protein
MLGRSHQWCIASVRDTHVGKDRLFDASVRETVAWLVPVASAIARIVNPVERSE